MFAELISCSANLSWSLEALVYVLAACGVIGCIGWLFGSGP